MTSSIKIQTVRRDSLFLAAAVKRAVFGLTLSLAVFGSAFHGIAGATAPASPDNTREQSALAAWWNGKGVTGDWLGARPFIAGNGVTLGGTWRGIFFGILDSENGSGNAFTQELVFSGRVDFLKLTKAQTLDGLAGFIEGRWREPGYDANPNNIVEASNLFNPSRISGGLGWRLVTFGLTYKTPELLGVENLVTLTAGWLRPQREFVQQPLSGLFANNAMAVAKGLGGNIPFSASFSSWGGTLLVEPVKWQYTKLGLFMSYPEATLSSNNGLMFQGYTPDPSENGLFFMGESGFTPEIGSSRLPGRYAFGTYFYQEDNPQFGTNKYGFYWQADQMLYREPSVSSDKLNSQGLSLFSLATFAPNGYNNNYPFYFQSGLVYEGLIPSRDRDQVLLGIAFGEYSEKNVKAAQRRRRPAPSNTTFLEAGYRIKLNGWSFVQPFAQYIVQPNGTTAVANAAILGLFMGVDF
jgi:porin